MNTQFLHREIRDIEQQIADLEALNAELVETLKQLQGMGLGKNAYAICAEAITKAANDG